MELIKKLISDKLVFSSFVTNCIYSFAYPTVHYELIRNVGQKAVSLNMIAMCISGIIFPILWNKYSNKLYKKYNVFCNLETILYVTLCVSFLLGFVTPYAYYFLDTFAFCFISKSILCGNNKLKVLTYDSDKRMEFDNNIQLVSNASSLIGYFLSLLITVPLGVSFILFTIGVILDNLFYVSVWKKTLIKLDS